MIDEVLHPRIELIRHDRVRGAGDLAVLALKMLSEHSITAIAQNSEELLAENTELAVALFTARPSMAPVSNAMRRYLSVISALKTPDYDLNSMRATLEDVAEEHIMYLSRARQKCINNATAQIQHGQCLVSCSFSSTVVAVLIKANEIGKNVRVIWPESCFREYCYGPFSQAALTENGIPCQLIDDDEIGNAVQSGDMVLLGADTILPDGDIVNGFPSYQVVKATRRARGPIPVYCIADSSKILWTSPPEHFEEGLDIVPHEWIEGIILEQGMIHPRQIRSLRSYLK